MNMKKMKIELRKQDGNLYNFAGVDHSLHFRFKSFNFQNQVIGIQ